MLPYEIMLVPALLILASEHLVEAWRWWRIIRRRPAFRRKLTIALLVVIAVCQLITLGDHVAAAAHHISKGVSSALILPAGAQAR